MSRFRKIIRDLRIQREYTQYDLAKILSISRTTISMYESGQREPDFQTLEQMTKVFNVDMNYLFGIKEEKPKPSPPSFKSLKSYLTRNGETFSHEQKKELIVTLLDCV